MSGLQRRKYDTESGKLHQKKKKKDLEATNDKK